MAMVSLQMAAVDLPIYLARILSPSFVLLVTLTLFFVKPTPPGSLSEITPVVVANTIPRRAVILSLLTLAALSYLLDGLAFVVFAILDHDWPNHTGIPINTITGLIAFSGLAALGTWKDIHGVHVWQFRRINLAIALSLAADISLAAFLTLHLRDGGPSHVFTIRALVHVVFPAFRVIVLLPLLGALGSPRVIYASTQAYGDIEEPTRPVSSFLLPHDGVPQSSTGLNTGTINLNGESSKYGTFRVTRQPSAPATRSATPVPSTAPDLKIDSKSEISYDPSWSEIWGRLQRLTPYLWPQKSPSLQFLAFLCTLILMLGRVVNLAMPLTLGYVVSILEGRVNETLWPYLLGYVGFRFLQGSGGLAAIRAWLWAPVMQYSDREMSQLSFNHLLNLSFGWHTHRKTGEILRVLDRGAAINHTLELMLFNIVPTFIDILIALVAFCVIFKWTLGLVLFFVMFAYVAASVILTRWRTQLKRKMNERDIITRGIHTDCLLNYETVKYFNGERHEGERYAEALHEYQELEYKVITSLNLLNLVQNFIITSGLLAGSLMVAHEITSVTSGPSDSSKFVIFITYLSQLYGPLNQLGFIYRSINSSLVDTEKLLALLNEPTEVNDKPGAPELVVHNGEIEFDNVHFSYDGRIPALNGVSFKVPKGSSVALVGESGSGKSTVLRLLYRFYDLGEGEGRILIDGQDIRDVTQRSLRQAIGVVPQESVLFNSSISYNIGYGKIGATSEEIEDAARSAQMHDRIMSFPDGYSTKVGERGVRLSGGEKQRVAIARTLLKNPPILLLDEATSALDTSTEKDIQKALQNLVKGRSSVSIAHRLSTIASSDIILVLKDGQIVEQGSFRDLVQIEHGVFASMWADQVTSSDDANGSIKKRLSGYSVGTSRVESSKPAGQSEEIMGKDMNLASEAVQETDPATNLQAEPLTDVMDYERKLVDEPESIEPSAVPAAMFAFPTSDEPVETGEPTTVSGPSVTFGTGVNSPPSRTGTPDPEAEPKRKRISSQNFQRLARRLSLNTRRQGSSSSIIPGIPGIPGLGKRDSSPKVPIDDPSKGESSGRNSIDTPAESLKGDDKSKVFKRKDKKSRKGSIG